MIVTIPWPDKILSPNARSHFHAKAKATKLYRDAAYWLAKQAQSVVMASDGEIMLSIVFRPPDKRRRDLDNMLASIKGAIDGIADALEVNDQRFAITLRRGEPVKSGAVIITIEEMVE